MSLFSRHRRFRASPTDATAFDEQVTALRDALASCQAYARRSKRALALVVAVLVLSFGFMLIANSDAVDRARSGVMSALGVAEPVGGTAAAYDAHTAGDTETALRLSRPLAEQGDARAQSLLGLILRTGRGVPKDENEAAKWFRRAADQGDNIAQFELGFMYSTGRGVPQNFPEGLKWYRLAADGGNPKAQFNLGVMYFNGKGVPESNVIAHMWFNLAAAHFPSSDSHDREIAVKVRDVVAMKMTREEITEAQKMARDWWRR